MEVASRLQTLEPRQQTNSGNTDIARLAKGAGVSLIGRMVGRAMHLLGQVVIARLLGSEAFGLYTIVWTILRIVGLISPLGLGYGVIRYAPRYWGTDHSGLRGLLFRSLSLALLSGLLIGGSFYIAAPWIAGWVFQKPDLTSVIRWFSPAFLLVSGLNVAASATRVSQQMKYDVYTREITQPITHLLMVLVAYLLGWGLSGAIAASIGSFTVAFMLALYYLRCLFPEIFSLQLRSNVNTKELLTFSLPASFAGASTSLVIWVDRLMVGYFCPVAEVGIYQAAYQASILSAIILSAFNAILSPLIADLYHKNKLQQLDNLFKISTKWGFYLSVPFFLVICFAPREIMLVVFGTGYETGSMSLVILAMGQLINTGTGAVGLLLVMTGHQGRWFWISAMMLFTNIILNLLLIPRLGLVGAAVSSTCTVGGLFLLGLFQVRHFLKIWPYDKRYFKGVVAALLSAGALLFFGVFSTSWPVLNLLLNIMISVLIFGSSIILLGLDIEDRELVCLVRTRLKF